MLKGLSFKTLFSNEKGNWVRIRELNYLVEKGIITVDTKALETYVNQVDEEFNAYMKSEYFDDRMHEFLGRPMDDIEIALVETLRNPV